MYWIRRFLEFHGHEHPSRLAEEAANRFLTHLAVKEEGISGLLQAGSERERGRVRRTDRSA